MSARPVLAPRFALSRGQIVLWTLTTLLVLAAAGVMVRLGFWQLDRLAQRQARNAQLVYGMSLPALDLNGEIPADLAGQEYRGASARGEYDFSQQVLLRNQVWEGEAGYHLLTPLRIDGGAQTLLVDRGFIPLAAATAEGLRAYAQPGPVTVSGMLRRSQAEPRFGGVPDPALQPGQMRLEAWNFINLERLGAQMPGTLLEVYLIAAPEDGLPGAPRRSLPEADLSEGSHMGYALQWFAFALILLGGYPFYVRKQLQSRRA